MIVPAKQERDLTRAVLSFLEAATNAIPLDRTTELLATGRIQEAVDRAVTAAETALPTTPHRIAKAEVTLAEALTRAFASGAEQGAASVSFSLNLPDVAGAGWATREGAQLVTAMTREARAAIAGVVSEGLRTGVTPAQTAFMIRQVAGLSPAQAAAVSRYYTSFLQAAAAGQGAGALLNRFTLAPRITPNAAVAERAAERYAQRLRAHRALNIARTETQRAAHAGQLEAWQQLRDSGAFGNAHVVRQWLTAEDERVCPTCGPMHLTQAELSGSYSLPVQGEAAAATQGGVVLHPPAHPSCRCDEVITLYDQARPAQDATVGPRGESRRGPSVRNQPRQQPARSGTEAGSMSRQQIIDELRSLGYDGPVSYTKPRLLRILEEQRAKGSGGDVLKPLDQMTRQEMIDELKTHGRGAYDLSTRSDTNLRLMLDAARKEGKPPPQPGPPPTPRPPAVNLTRREILDELNELGYKGPTSYTKDKLAQILERERLTAVPGYKPPIPQPVQPPPAPTPKPTTAERMYPNEHGGDLPSPWADGPPPPGEFSDYWQGAKWSDDLDPAVRESAERAIARLEARYPYYVEEAQWVDKPLGQGTYANYSGGHIRLNNQYTRERFESGMARDLAANFHPSGGQLDAVEQMVMHEFGHSLHYDLIYSGERHYVAELDRRIAEYARSQGRTFFHGEIDKFMPHSQHEWTSAMSRETQSWLRSELSGYAATNQTELIAEAFSEYMSSPTPRPLARIVGQFFDEVFGPGGPMEYQ